tara:strand:+ start:174 stop:617 length:444 start_codon:yes stop_codon:yes gene_type:complete
MKKNKEIENSDRYQNYIIFEPASLRVHDADILIIGPDILQFHQSLLIELSKQKESLSKQTIRNQLLKIGQMLELVKNINQVIISKYFDRIWRRHAYITHLGESFLSLDIFQQLNKDEKYNDLETLISNRYVVDQEEESEEKEAAPQE